MESDPIARIDEALRDVYGGRAWLVACDVLVGGANMVKRLSEMGAHRSFVVACYRGTGSLPDAEVAEWRLLGLPTASMMDAIHGSERALRDLPSDVQQAVDAFDPDRSMMTFGAFFSNGKPVAGRRFYGARPLAWQALEDKVIIDDVWDAAGVPRAASRVVDVNLEALQNAAAELDEGHGTVWAGDMREGFHGGAQLTFWVRDVASASHAVRKLQERCDRARVMPFLQGLPCSMHGLVLPDRVVTTRPAEMLTLLTNRGGGLVYGRAASCWLPEATVLEDFRAMAVSVGEHLRAQVGYRGAFTIDGVLTADGFRPTELNPRVGAAMGLVFPGFDAPFVNAMIIEGVDLGVSGEALEHALREASMTRCRASVGLMSDVVVEGADKVWLRWQDDGWLRCEEADADAYAMFGPGTSGGYGGLYSQPDALVLGEAFAGRAAAFYRWADASFDLNLGPVWAADATGPPSA